MKIKALATLTLLLSSGMTLAAGGGQNINNVMPPEYTSDNTVVTEIKAQGPLDAFKVEAKNNEKVNTSSLKQTSGSLDDNYLDIS